MKKTFNAELFYGKVYRELSDLCEEFPIRTGKTGGIFIFLFVR